VKLTVEYEILPRDGEAECGDAVVVKTRGDVTLLAVVDALGHGPAAADVARLAVAHLEESAGSGGALETMRGLHEALRDTRGAAALVCLVGRGRIEGCGVGNVDLVARGAEIPAVLTNGILGRANPRFRRFEGRLAAGSRVAIFTDGVSARLSLDDTRALPPRAACRAILASHRRNHDDATVLIADAETGP
jgi:phosphoserine phosphatase RsbX